MGAGLRPTLKGVETPPDPKAGGPKARAQAIVCVNGQQSAEAVVAVAVLR